MGDAARDAPLFGAALAACAPHLAEEALTRMHDDPLLDGPLSPFATMSPRHAAYAAFQVTFLGLLTTAFLVALGGRFRAAVLVALGVALLAEGHHLVRWLVTFSPNSGLATSLPMPLVGLFILSRVQPRST